MAKLHLPARVANTTFGIGCDESLVVDAAQRWYEAGHTIHGWVERGFEEPPEDQLLECAVRRGWPDRATAGPLYRMFLIRRRGQWYSVTWTPFGPVPSSTVDTWSLVAHWRLATLLPGEHRDLNALLPGARPDHKEPL